MKNESRLDLYEAGELDKKEKVFKKSEIVNFFEWKAAQNDTDEYTLSDISLALAKLFKNAENWM